MSKKHTLEYIKNYFKEQNCECLATEYKNNHTPVPYICSCGNKTFITFHNFQQGQRCINCGISKCSNGRKHSLEYVKSYFKEHGCECLAVEYINNEFLLSYICNCGNKAIISFGGFQQGRRCYKCQESKGEKIISSYLEKQNIIFKRQWRFELCKNKKPLPFDFAVFTSKKISLIEYQGEHHFFPRRNTNAIEKFIKTIKHDKIKDQWCRDNKIPLLIIPYWDKENIDKKLNSFLDPVQAPIKN